MLSYARAPRAPVSHPGRSFNLSGSGDVITGPGSPRNGYGGRIVEEATTHIKADPWADAALLLTERQLVPFYRRSGWEYVRGLRVATSGGDEGAAEATIPMMLFISAKAQAARPPFTEDTLVLPGDEW